MPRLILLDALNLIYRAYYVFIGRPLRNSRGENTSAIYGFANMALKFRRELSPDRWALAWDGPGPTVRHQMYAEYKATRKPMPDDLTSQLTPIEELATAIGLPVIEKQGMEADDVLATLARQGREAGYEVLIVTGDKDMLQVVDDRVHVLAPAGKGEEYARVDPAAVREKWGVGPDHIRDVLALMGDTIDNIPGVPGIGEKTAVELMMKFGSLEQLYERLGEITKPALKRRLEEHREDAFLSRELATVHADLDVGISLDELRCAPIRRDDLLEIARHWEIRRLEKIALEQGAADGDAGARVASRPNGRLAGGRQASSEMIAVSGQSSSEGGTARTPPSAEAARPPLTPVETAPEIPLPPEPPPAPAFVTQGTLDLWGAVSPSEADAALAPMIERLHAVRARSIHGLGILPLVAGDEPRTATVVGLALAARDGTTGYLPIAHETGPNLGRERVVAWLRGALADAAVPKVGMDLKRDAHALATLDLPLAGGVFDLHLGSFLLDPSRGHDLSSLALDLLGVELPPVTPPAAGRGRAGVAAIAVAEADAVLSARVAQLFPIAEAIRAQLEAREMWRLYERLEHPLIAVLLDMERAGVAVDAAQLGAMGARAAEDIESLRRELVAMAGDPAINLDSGPQVAKILFETLKLAPGGRTPSGALSTRSDVLEELAPLHPFPARLLEYRALSKLKSTYFDTLPRALDPRDGRVHTTYHQAGANTGRLSSSNPNLQNIPMRTAQGRAIRRAFVAPPGHMLIGADYSQIELRVMAHLSGDPSLAEAFATGQDVHEATARRIFNRADGALEPELRARAKIVNFGIMYGMGARSLSQQMGIALNEATDFIASYFKVYARVREFIDRTIDDARRRGYVTTLLGHRIGIPGLADDHGGRRAAAERFAINAPIQGSAADLMKLAMIRVHRALKARHPSARLLLQVHDELVLETPMAEVDAVSELVRAEMEQCFALRVPLTVSIGVGPTWFDVH
jgi:DNA polymerase-1